jgi:hypothetical protein
VTVVGATTSGAVVLNCAQPAQASMKTAPATRIDGHHAALVPGFERLRVGTLKLL